MHNWELDSIALSKQQAYAARVVMRRPSMTARIEQRRQTVEVVCFLHATLIVVRALMKKLDASIGSMQTWAS